MRQHGAKRILYCLLSAVLVLVSVFGTVAGNQAKINAAEEVILHNPVVDMDAMCAGQKVTWDCLYFGSYPQTEVKAEDSEYAALQSVKGWDDNGDVIINGTKYRRMLKWDATYATSRDTRYYDWDDYTTYHYFRYEPVKWRVLETDGDKAMLLSDIVLDDRKYNTENKDTTWETSTIRSWLNGYGTDVNQESIDYSSSNFIDSAFTVEEQSAIADTDVVNNDNPNYDTEGGNNTVDKLFLLSESEVHTATEYGFTADRSIYDESRRCNSSDYAKAMGVNSNYAIEWNCGWWLRSPGCNSYKAAIVYNYGYVNHYGNIVSSGDNGVRVALNLNLSSSNLYTCAGTVCSDGTITESENQEGSISNPRIVKVKVMDISEGQNTKWDCVYFGSYPQTEVKYTDSEYAALQGAEGWNNNGDVVIDGTKYRKMLKSDATNDYYYDWEDDATYHYFRYEPIKWRVLETDGNEAMLLSDIVLDNRKYNTEWGSTTWETSTIRSWLNGYSADVNQESIDYSGSNFMDSAFTIEEQSAIADTNVVNTDNLRDGTKGGNDTVDKLFLLSESEMYTNKAKAYGFASDYFITDISRRCKSSDYANAMGVYIGKFNWWLRSPGNYGNKTAIVYNDGCISNYGYNTDKDDFGVRVALNLNLSSSNLYSYAGMVCSDGTVNMTGEPTTEESGSEEVTTEEPPTSKPTAKQPQVLKVTKSYTKSYGAKDFSLNAKLTNGNGRLEYTTSDKKVAVADSTGKVSIKGTGICTITVKADATDTCESTAAKITITVKPKKNKVTKLKLAGSRTLNVIWEKDTKGAGYELQYSTSKNFARKTTITVNIGKNKTTSYEIRKLIKGKKYYIRVRAYQNVKVNGKIKKLYSDWSAVKQSGKVK